MTRTQEFDLVNSSLDGKNLVEASAGTGKTFTIAGLYLRLLLEKRLDVEQILVVTFTEAATNELTDRIRKRLREAKEAFVNSRSDDLFLRAYIKKSPGLGQAIDRLNSAMRDFDKAAIFTIHGFCNKILLENAFESGGLFDTELVTEQNDLLQEVVEDFWRQQMYRRSRAFVAFAQKELKPRDLFDLLNKHVGIPDLRIIPDVEVVDFEQDEKMLVQSFQRLKQSWSTSRATMEDYLLTNPGLNRRVRDGYPKAQVPEWINAMDVYLAADAPAATLIDKFEKFTRSEIARNSKGHRGVESDFPDQCETHQEIAQRVERAYEQNLMALKTELFSYARHELARRKKERNIQFFDDLLINVYAALNNHGGGLIDAVRQQFKAALIDEFQDTDPVQYAIFEKLFDTESCSLFLIGDPKQAIYGFRGADIFAYMRAKGNTERHYTLSRNWRAEPELIDGINTIFSNNDNAFLYSEIPFENARAPEPFERERLSIEDGPEGPLQLWYVDPRGIRDRGYALNRTQARQTITQRVAWEIARLLNLGREGKARLGKRSLEERDIAVLVRANLEARMLQAVLADVGVHAVLYSSASLFESNEATEVERVLAAIVEPKRLSKLKAAITTDIMGVSGNELLALNDDEDGLERWFDRFSDYHMQWHELGFMRMFKKLLGEQKILQRLMIFTDGERRITNLLHLSEVLHEVAVERRLGMAALLKWLSEQIAHPAQGREIYELRLESDENAVKLVTMHMSKGLEYPVVFCPFTWYGSSRIGKLLTFHDEEHDRRFTLDLDATNRPQHAIYARKELLAENLRLLYVALTRAMNRCYLIWGRFWDDETSAPSYLFHPRINYTDDNIVETLKKKVKDLTDEQRMQAIEKIAERSQETIHVTASPEEEIRFRFQPFEHDSAELACPQFETPVDHSQRISSYSALVSQHPHGAELADYDDVDDSPTPDVVEAPEPEPFTSFLTFPGGAKTGTFIHHILENIDFTQVSGADGQELIARTLQSFGYEKEWHPVILELLTQLARTPLNIEQRSLSLAEVATERRLNELEFYFPLNRLSGKRLHQAFAKHLAGEGAEPFLSKLKALSIPALQGFMKGFVDLIFEHEGRFYIIDWKSNFLGKESRQYTAANIARAMADNLYILQYHIYAVALVQYLRIRMPDFEYERHFGGVFYVFLRGITAETDSGLGVYSDCPPGSLIDLLEQELVSTAEGGQ